MLNSIPDSNSWWKPDVESHRIDEPNVWYLFRYPEYQGKILCTLRLNTEYSVGSVHFDFVDGALIRVTASYVNTDPEVNELEQVQFYLYKNKLIHLEKNRLHHQSAPAVVTRQDREILELLRSEIPADVYTLVAEWNTGHAAVSPIRNLSSFNLAHLMDIRPLAGAAVLLQDPEFVSALEHLLAHQEAVLPALVSWLKTNPPVERLSDGSALLVNAVQPMQFDGWYATELVLAIDLKTGSLMLGMRTVDYGNTGMPYTFHLETKTIYNKALLDILRPFFRNRSAYLNHTSNYEQVWYRESTYSDYDGHDGDWYDGGMYNDSEHTGDYPSEL